MILSKNKKYFIIFILFFFLSHFEKVNAATLYFSPTSGNQTVGNIMNVSVLVNTQGQVINSADAVITYPTKFLEVVSINKSDSIFSFWVEDPTFSNNSNSGIINLGGGLPTPGYNGTSGKIISITFRLKTSGLASLIFSSGAVRANDGFGTDVLKSTDNANFTISAPAKVEPVVVPEPTTKPIPVVSPEPVKEVIEKPEQKLEPLPEPMIKEIPMPSVAIEHPVSPTTTLYTIFNPLALAMTINLILLIIIAYGRHRFVHLRIDMRREAKDMDMALHHSLQSVKQDATACVALLEKTKNKRRLTGEEKVMVMLLERHVKETEKIIVKELQDIRESIEG